MIFQFHFCFTTVYHSSVKEAIDQLESRTCVKFVNVEQTNVTKLFLDLGHSRIVIFNSNAG